MTRPRHPSHPNARPARPTTAARLAGLAAAALGLGGLGCLNVPEAPEDAPMCTSHSECDLANGEVCEEGVCWGNPPAGTFAAVLSSPSTRRDLVTTELGLVSISSDGWVSPTDDPYGELRLEAPVTLSGRVVAFCPPTMPEDCEDASLGATITLSRPAQFTGGPAFRSVVTVEPDADSFSLSVPRTQTPDRPYTVTVTPSAERATAAELPPLRTSMAITENATNKVFTLGGSGLPVISGALANALAGYRVVAVGRWSAGEAPTEVSTVATTDAAGAYSITLSEGLTGPVELVARPPTKLASGMPAPTAPTVRLSNIGPAESSQHRIELPVDLGAETTLTVTVTGAEQNGAISMVAGAVVTLTGTVTSAQASFTISDQQVTNDKGVVVLRLLDGAALTSSYRLSIVPPASSSLGALFDQKLVSTTTSLNTPAVGLPGELSMRLPARFALRGQIVDTTGRLLGGVAITARPSLRFLWALETASQAFVAAIPAATAVTDKDGTFVVWVDPAVGQTRGVYDLLIEPPTTIPAPSYLLSEVMVPADTRATELQLNTIALPAPAFVHGRIIGPDGEPVENAEIKLYTPPLGSLDAVCMAAYAPMSCPLPAQLQARNTSDANGVVRLALPR